MMYPSSFSIGSQRNNKSQIQQTNKAQLEVVCGPQSKKGRSSGGFCIPPSTNKKEICPGERPLRCEKGKRLSNPPCGPAVNATNIQWCNREVVCDEVGAGIRPKSFTDHQRKYCCTPMSQYMNIHGEFAKKALTREVCVARSINGPPPSEVAEFCFPPCRGYYRRHECVKPDEYHMMKNQDGKKVLRNVVDRYWNPCAIPEGKDKMVADLAGHNVGLLKRMVVARGGTQCW